MAAESEEGCLSKERPTWSDEKTRALINIWETSLPYLRGAKRNLNVYMTIAERLRAVGIRKNTKEVKQKIQNMGNKYRTGTKTGAGGIPWKFYWDLHRLLGSLPANDSSLMEESGCSAIDGASPEGLFNGMVHGGVGELQELGTDSQLPEGCLDSCEVQASPLESAAEIVPEAPTTTAAEKKRLAAPAKLLAQLLD
ncbi:hypothetical protein HPB49_018538 [Dermacentor silvarum]|uniref:Uncharacterized protein n=1 Tax=Dermacentor silvarum TaxID=543639 RepID=A0ACB8D7D3_DERSI|nr:hypothetical protein HPB49_018538 [Dermacentor silvarum]